jgi:hypothetical protein
MNEQLNVRLPGKLLKDSQKYATQFGFSNVQELIKDTLRERVYDGLSLEYLRKRVTESEKSPKFSRKEAGL